MAAALLLREMQQLLGGFYDLELADDVRDYLVTDASLLDTLTGGDGGRAMDEKLLVMQGDDAVDLALYLDAALLDRLAAADPRHQLSRHNLGDFWTALEGISHFNYLAWNAALDKPVTLLELEMQAEVDKYVGTRLLLERQPGADLGAPLLDSLFEAPGYDTELSAGELERYRDASHLAGRYCHNLHSRFPVNQLSPAMVRELRSFFRLPQSAKVSRIRAAHFA